MKSKKLNIIEKSIGQLVGIFRKSNKFILNEFDAQCQLFYLIRKNLPKSQREIVHSQCNIANENIRPDLIVLSNTDIKIEQSKKDKYEIKRWSQYVLSAIEIKCSLKSNSDYIYRKISSDLNKLRKAKLYNSYVIFLHHSSKLDNRLLDKLKKLSKNSKRISIVYSIRTKTYMIKKGICKKIK